MKKFIIALILSFFCLSNNLLASPPFSNWGRFINLSDSPVVVSSNTHGLAILMPGCATPSWEDWDYVYLPSYCGNHPNYGPAWIKCPGNPTVANHPLHDPIFPPTAIYVIRNTDPCPPYPAAVGTTYYVYPGINNFPKYQDGAFWEPAVVAHPYPDNGHGLGAGPYVATQIFNELYNSPIPLQKAGWTSPCPCGGGGGLIEIE